MTSPQPQQIQRDPRRSKPLYKSPGWTYFVTRMFDGGRLVPHHVGAANQVRGTLTVKQEQENLRHRTTLVARLTQPSSMAKQIPPLFDVQLVCSTGDVWTLTGYERVTSGVMREDVMLGQAWLITPAPLEDLRKAELEGARLAALVDQLQLAGAVYTGSGRVADWEKRPIAFMAPLAVEDASCTLRVWPWGDEICGQTS